MANPINDILRQARAGSVSAIIQVLNERFADSGVRTRAMLDDGVLQLLCEAPTADQLEQTSLVDRIRKNLEAIGPRNIRRVNINSRIVREQQLLWLDEIKRNPEDLLWSQAIKLPKPNPVQRFLEDRKLARLDAIYDVPKPERDKKEIRQFWRGILVGGASLGLLLLLVGWAVSDWLNIDLTSRGAQSNTEAANQSTASPSVSAIAQDDPFVQAVRLAEQAAQEGKTASTSAQWLEIASRWQRASDLMTQIAPEDQRYSTAQSRIGLYQQNSQAALQKANQLSAN